LTTLSALLGLAVLFLAAMSRSVPDLSFVSPALVLAVVFTPTILLSISVRHVHPFILLKTLGCAASAFEGKHRTYHAPTEREAWEIAPGRARSRERV